MVAVRKDPVAARHPQGPPASHTIRFASPDSRTQESVTAPTL